MSDENDYKVGDKHPPKDHQWKPGHSGNPKGRPKKTGVDDIRAVMEEVLTEQVKTRDGDSVRKISREEAIMNAELKNALTGDTRAIESLFKRAQKCGLFSQAVAPSLIQMAEPEGDAGKVARMLRAEEEAVRKAAEEMGFSEFVQPLLKRR
jgi:Family of unknown function (DUF5681)